MTLKAAKRHEEFGWPACSNRRYSPPPEEGWLRHQQNFGEAHLSAADGVVAHKPWFKNAFPNMVCERPPRPLH